MRIILCALALSAIPLSPATAYAFNARTHEQITKSMVIHLYQHAHWNVATDKWLGLNDSTRNLGLSQLLIRASVDEDYRPNIWLDAPLHRPFVGVKRGVVSLFTSFTHHLNLTVPGIFWDHDGYAYRHTDGTGNDQYMSTPGVKINGDLSSGLGGERSSHAPTLFEIGRLILGFLGSPQDWHKLFFEDNPVKDAIFPPSEVPAELALRQMLDSPRAEAPLTQEWNEELPLATGLLSTENMQRIYKRSEIEKLPAHLDKLGTILHLIQDLSVPHHTEGTMSYCHPEFEAWLDEMACHGRAGPDSQIFDDGTFDHLEPEPCQNLYDPSLVEELRNQIEAIHPRRDYTLTERMQKAAYETLKWSWKKDASLPDYIVTRLPDGQEFLAKDCATLLRIPAIQQQMRYQYNFAVALSVGIFEILAAQYEKIH